MAELSAELQEKVQEWLKWDQVRFSWFLIQFFQCKVLINVLIYIWPPVEMKKMDSIIVPVSRKRP